MLAASTPLNISGNSVSTSMRIAEFSAAAFGNRAGRAGKTNAALESLRNRSLRIRCVFEQAGHRIAGLGAHFNPVFHAGLVDHHAPGGILGDGVVKPEFFNDLAVTGGAAVHGVDAPKSAILAAEPFHANFYCHANPRKKTDKNKPNAAIFRLGYTAAGVCDKP